MKTLAWLLAPLLLFLLAVPLAVALMITTLVAPPRRRSRASRRLRDTVPADGHRRPASPCRPPGTERRASLTNPPTEIPAGVLTLYQQAAAAHGLPWPLLAGVGMAETNHGRLTATSTAGAQGLMQFLPATFNTYGVDADGDGRATITSDADSIFSAANYLAASGATEPDAGVRRSPVRLQPRHLVRQRRPHLRRPLRHPSLRHRRRHPA